MTDSLEVRRRIQCARHGHPPVVTTCFGYVYCARCGQQIGDTLAGAFDLMRVAMAEHAGCKHCEKIIAKLTPQQRRLTPGLPKRPRARKVKS